MTAPVELAWPRHRMGEALMAVASATGLSDPGLHAPAPGITPSEAHLPGWVDRVAGLAGLEVERITLDYRRVRAGLDELAPAVLRPTGGDGAVLCLLSTRRRWAWLMSPTLERVRVPTHELCASLCAGIGKGLSADTDELLVAAGVTVSRLTRAREAILVERLGERAVADAWLIELAPSRPLAHHLARANVPRLLAGLALCHGGQYLLWIAAWMLLGRTALQGQSAGGWFAAWALLLVTMLPLQTLTYWLASLVGMAAGGVVRARLLHGALRLDPDDLRRAGSGQLLGRVLESENIETLALGAGLIGLVATLELVVAAGVLTLGVTGGIHALLLAAWLLLTALAAHSYHRRRIAWSEGRLGLTGTLVERLVGYRTTLVQERREEWHRDEDYALASYVTVSKEMDRAATWLNVAIPRGWLFVGLAGLIPALLVPGPSLSGVAVSLGGVLLVQRALAKLVPGLMSLAGARVAWGQVGALFRAACSSEALGADRMTDLLAVGTSSADEDSRPTIEARDLHFGYDAGRRPTLAGCSLRLHAGERMLLEGPSGSGKSTLAALLAGWRTPQSGLLLLGGLDWHSRGASDWRRRVVAVPQFHQNHVLTETFAFNLLMGRGGRTDAGSLRQAEEICARLGLDELLRKMPGGLLQMVGDTGWQLSHGERSRLYMARALLQGADLVVLDESFAALDPRTLEQCLSAALDLAPALVVIAHP